jgi:hypothetical protein
MIAQSRSQMESWCWAKRYVTGAYLSRASDSTLAMGFSLAQP